jgi:transposase
MAGKRLTMRKTREVLRLRWQLGRSVRETSRALGISTGVVDRATFRAKTAGLTWEATEALNDVQLEELLYGRPSAPKSTRPEPDPAWIHQELKKKGVTLELLHFEYLQEHPEGYKYTSYCERYRRWKKARALVLRQEHKAGDKLFVDFSGNKPYYIDRATGERIEVELFVAALGASSYTYTDILPSQEVKHWIEGNRHALEYIGGVTAAIVPDNLKSAVQTPDPYEPTIQATFADFGRHYGTAIVPARVYKPRDKAKAEAAVLVAQRWILARLRNQVFYSFAELRAAVEVLREVLNDRPRKHLGGVTRRELFERLDRPALSPLPDAPFEASDWHRVRVNVDYHVQVEKHYYSAPYALVHQTLEARVTARTVELFYAGQRVATHPRSSEPYKHTTAPAHRPPNHRAWVEGDPGDLITWGTGLGPHTETLVRRILDRSPFPEQAWRSARGLRRVGESYPPERVEEACRRALLFGAQSYKPVARMLKNDLDLRPLDTETSELPPLDHDQIRGAEYYH